MSERDYAMNSRILVFVVAAGLALSSGTAEASGGFQLKGVSIGMSPRQACGSASVTDKLGDIVRMYKAEAPDLVEMGTAECDVSFPSFGGVPLVTPVKLLFKGDALIQAKIEFEGLSMDSLAGVRTALISQYGNPKSRRSPPFATDVWSASGQTLQLERFGRSWDDNDVTIILRDDIGFKRYMEKHQINSMILKRLGADRARRDTR